MKTGTYDQDTKNKLNTALLDFKNAAKYLKNIIGSNKKAYAEVKHVERFVDQAIYNSGDLENLIDWAVLAIENHNNKGEQVDLFS